MQASRVGWVVQVGQASRLVKFEIIGISHKISSRDTIRSYKSSQYLMRSHKISHVGAGYFLGPGKFLGSGKISGPGKTSGPGEFVGPGNLLDAG